MTQEIKGSSRRHSSRWGVVGVVLAATVFVLVLGMAFTQPGGHWDSLFGWTIVVFGGSAALLGRRLHDRHILWIGVLAVLFGLLMTQIDLSSELPYYML